MTILPDVQLFQVSGPNDGCLTWGPPVSADVSVVGVGDCHTAQVTTDSQMKILWYLASTFRIGTESVALLARPRIYRWVLQMH